MFQITSCLLAECDSAKVPLGAPGHVGCSTFFHCVSHGMLPGAWELSVVGRDPAGNEAAPQAYPWRVAYQAGAPYTRFLR